jgi:hypothetical protein
MMAAARTTTTATAVAGQTAGNSINRRLHLRRLRHPRRRNSRATDTIRLAAGTTTARARARTETMAIAAKVAATTAAATGAMMTIGAAEAGVARV